MAEDRKEKLKKRHGLHAVTAEEASAAKTAEEKEPPEERRSDYKAVIRSHRLKILLRNVIILSAIAAAIIGTWYYFSTKQYDSFEIQSEVERKDTAATHFEAYYKGLLKYSNDGAFYTDLDNSLIWNQTYEMEHPKTDITDRFLAIGDVGGMELYILDETGQKGKISTTMPIYAFTTAAQGTTAVLLSGENTFYLNLYAAEGTELASGQLFVENSGYPLSIAISPDGKKLALSSMKPTGDRISTIITFYNFGSVGQNEPDNIVGTYSYDDMVVPEMDFISDDLMLAFGDTEVMTFSGAEKPEPSEMLPINGEIKSVFHDNTYFGLIFNNEDEENTRRIEVYDRNCRNVMTESFTMDYSTVEFLNNHEVCIKNDTEVVLFGLNGVQRFTYSFDVPVAKMVHEHLGMYYTLVCEGSTKKIRLQ